MSSFIFDCVLAFPTSLQGPDASNHAGCSDLDQAGSDLHRLYPVKGFTGKLCTGGVSTFAWTNFTGS